MNIYKLISENKNLNLVTTGIDFYYGFIFNSQYFYNNLIFYSRNDNYSISFMQNISNYYYYCKYKIHLYHWLFFHTNDLLIFFKYADESTIFLLYKKKTYDLQQFNNFDITIYLNQIKSNILLNNL